MSYARFGWDGSDVYVYLDVAGHLACCGCALGSPVHRSTADMLAHLDAHRSAGHRVPEACIEQLKADAEENDTWIAGLAAQP